jgi:hypothetical protein
VYTAVNMDTGSYMAMKEVICSFYVAALSSLIMALHIENSFSENC